MAQGLEVHVQVAIEEHLEGKGGMVEDEGEEREVSHQFACHIKIMVEHSAQLRLQNTNLLRTTCCTTKMRWEE